MGCLILYTFGHLVRASGKKRGALAHCMTCAFYISDATASIQKTKALSISRTGKGAAFDGLMGAPKACYPLPVPYVD